MSPPQIRTSGTLGTLVRRRTVHVVASTVVFGAVPAALPLAIRPLHDATATETVPLWKEFITTNVSSLARFAALSGLGMTFTRWSSTWTRHSLIRVLMIGEKGLRLSIFK